MRFHVVGCGSIGQRHIRNLLLLGHEVSLYDADSVLAKKISKQFGIKYTSTDIVDNVDCILVCTPPVSHIQLATKALRKNTNVFIEKPLSNTNNIAPLLKLAKKSRLKIFVGYSFRFDKGLQTVKKLLSEKKIGKIVSFDAYEGWYLPLWRPWQDHTKSYTGSEKLGGGIVLDGSHEANYLQWLGGNIAEVFSYYSTIPSLGVKAEGLAEVLLRFQSKAIGRIHLDFLNPKYNRHCEILGEKGSIRWYFENKTVEIQKIGSSKHRTIKYGKDNNQMYLDEIKHVVSCISGNKRNNLIDLTSAQKTLEVSLAIKKSGKTRRAVLV